MRTRYIALVEVAADSLGAVDDISETLADFEPSLRKVRPGLWQVRMRIQADGLSAACANAASVAQAVTGAPAVSAHVVSEAHHEQGAGFDTLPPSEEVRTTRDRSTSGATRGQGDLNGVLSGTYVLRDPDSLADRAIPPPRARPSRRLRGPHDEA